MVEKQLAQKNQLIRARDTLDRMLALPTSEAQIMASIKAFEFCFDLSWKFLKTLVESDAGFVSSPKAVFREAAKHGFIDNPEEWFKFLETRNLTVHTYNNEVANMVYSVVSSGFRSALSKLIDIKDV